MPGKRFFFEITNPDGLMTSFTVSEKYAKILAEMVGISWPISDEKDSVSKKGVTIRIIENKSNFAWENLTV